jgi:hypothetical protein
MNYGSGLTGGRAEWLRPLSDPADIRRNAHPKQTNHEEVKHGRFANYHDQGCGDGTEGNGLRSIQSKSSHLNRLTNIEFVAVDLLRAVSGLLEYQIWICQSIKARASV